MTNGRTETAALAPSIDEAARRLRPFDFRNPSKLPREQVRRMELTHETFQRAFGAQLSSVLRTMVRLELLAIDHVDGALVGGASLDAGGFRAIGAACA